MLLLTPAASVHADTQAQVSLTATPSVIEADGKSTTIITATVRGGDGGLVPDGSTVFFTTTLGTLAVDSSATIAGAARVSLTSSSTAGTALVTATFYGGSNGGGIGTNSLKVEFTSDKELVSTDGNSRWIRIDCKEYMIYSADGKVIQAEGKNAVHFRYGALYIDGDSLQVDLQTMQVIGRNVTMRRGKHSLRVAQVSYDLFSTSGTAVLPGTDTTQPSSVMVTGSAFDTVALTPMAADEGVQHNIYAEMDLSNSRLIVAARAMAIDPGVQIQFTKAVLYSDGKKMMSMAFHIMPLTTDQLFGEQVVGFSSEGLFLNIPYYYHVSPDSTGTIYLRNSAVASSGIVTGLAPTFGSTGTRPGLAFDLQHTYTDGGGNGAFVLNSLTRSDWGASWTHSQTFDPLTSSYVYLDYPEHRGLFATTNVRHMFKTYSLTVSGNASDDPGYGGYAENTRLIDADIQTNPKPIGRTRFSYSNDLTIQSGEITQVQPGSPVTTTNLSTQALDLGIASTPYRLDKKSNLTDSMSFGETYDTISHQSSLSYMATLGATRSLQKNGTLSLNYNFKYDPLMGYYSQQTTTTGPSFFNPAVQQTLSLSGTYLPSSKSFVNLTGYYSPSSERTSLFSNYTYRLDNNWGLGLSGIMENDFLGHYDSLDLSVTRRILNRYVVFSYGTDTHRLNFNLGAGQF